MKSLLLSFLILTLALVGCKARREAETKPMPRPVSNVTLKQTLLDGATSSTLFGQILEKESGDPMPYATVVLKQNGITHSGANTDENGRFKIIGIAEGVYEVHISYLGYISKVTGIVFDKPCSIQLDAQLEGEIVQTLKPVIYLYPTEKTEIAVQLRYDGKLTHTYPTYPENGWKVIAEPNGTLHDEKGMEYYALYWEGEPSQPLAPKDGFVVPGKETASFLEEKLALLGLSRREANEFIMYWLPQMEDNAYNLIHFAGQDYEEQATLLISPQPETRIRVMMVTCPLERAIDFPLQDLSAMKKTRRGYTMVEWGGSVISGVKGSEAF